MACFGGDISLFCHVLLLDEAEYPLEIRKKTKGFEVLEKVFDHLNLLERDYFGLRYIDKSGQSRWLDPLKVVIKQLKSGPPYLLYFGVKFYAPDPCKLQEELTRYQFFMQVKRDIFQGRLPCSYNLLVELSAYAIQSEIGDYDPRENTDGYVSEFRFIPNQTEDLEEKVSSIHRKLTGLVPSVAEIMYLDKIKWLEMYGVDLHPVKGDDFIDYFVALKPAGVVVYKNKTKVGTYLWPKIVKIDFKGKTFFLTVEAKNDMEYTYVFYLNNKSACKHLWKCCIEHHAFFRLEKLPNARKSSVGGLFRTGSGFRYSGRTHREVVEDSKRIARPSPDVLRKPSKRYERRNHQGSERAQSAVTVTSVSEVQIRKFSQSSTPNAGNKPAEVITVPVRTPSKPTTKTSGEPTSGDGNKTVINAVNGPALPWEQNADRQSGLYTPAPQSPHSLKHSGSGRSRKFPRPHRRSAGPSSGSETDTPRKRHRSTHGSHSDDDTGRRRRRRSRHRHRASGFSGSESEGQSSRGGRRHQRAYSEPENFSDYGDAAPYHWNVSRGLGRPGSVQDRSHQHKSLPPDRDARSDGSSSRRRHSKPMTEEMVPALDVIQSRVAVARVKDGTRHHHHRRHHHHHHSYYHTSNESLHSSVSASPATRPSPQGMQVLLQLGPGSSGQKYPQTPNTLPNSLSKRATQTGTPVTQQRSSPYKENIPYSEMPYGSLPNRMKQNGGSVNVGFPNGMIIAGTPPKYPPNTYTANGGVPGYSAQRENRDKNYIEMVSGPGQSPVYYQGRNRAMSGKSTML